MGVQTLEETNREEAIPSLHPFHLTLKKNASFLLLSTPSPRYFHASPATSLSAVPSHSALLDVRFAWNYQMLGLLWVSSQPLFTSLTSE